MIVTKSDALAAKEKAEKEAAEASAPKTAALLQL